MKKLFTLLLSLFYSCFAFAQGDCCILKKDEGIALYNQGKYEEAIRKFEQAAKSCDACDVSNWITLTKNAQASNSKPQDTDKDGINDKDDRCPQEKGDPRNHGCPVTPGGNDSETKVVNGFSFVMKWVKGGPFEMGNAKGEDNEKPQHTVNVFDFSLCSTEVTLAQFRNFVEDSKYKTESEKRGYSYTNNNGVWEKHPNVWWLHDGQGKAQVNEQAPVVNVTWKDANAYCEWLSRKTGKTYRLPSEAEWEYAAKGGGKSLNYKYAGSNELASAGWFGDNAENNVHTVTGKTANELGLYDMSGNVWEWTLDWYDDAYYQISPITDPRCVNIKSGGKSIRGGSFREKDIKSTSRAKMDPAYSASNVGFRVLLEN